MCLVCLSIVAAGTAAVAVDKKYNNSRVTDYIEKKLFNSEERQ